MHLTPPVNTADNSDRCQPLDSNRKMLSRKHRNRKRGGRPTVEVSDERAQGNDRRKKERKKERKEWSKEEEKNLNHFNDERAKRGPELFTFMFIDSMPLN